MNSGELYQVYKTKMQKIADVKYASAVLQWDQETYMPAKGGDIRGRQIASLTEIAHQLFTDEKMGGLLKDLLSIDGLDPDQLRNVTLSYEDYARNIKFTGDFVREMSEAINRSFHAWIQARKVNSFNEFSTALADVIAFKQQEADIIGYSGHPYDALMNDYDKGLTVEITDHLFSELKPELSILLNQISSLPQVKNEFLFQHFDKQKQWDFGMELLKRMGFDFEAGRQDMSEHPFTTNFHNQDVRVTTRINEEDLGNMTWSCIHEGGHALYEQGLPTNQYGLPLGEFCSLSIHESQSRLWENGIGRGISYWQHNFPLLQSYFPEQLKNVTAESFYQAINKVEPSLIRTEADELTYHFHIMIRHELEKTLIDKTLKVSDIPQAWNEKYQHYLGIKPADDNKGCLQDVHWSHGSFGYFPTYTLGSLYAAQFYAAIVLQNPSLNYDISQGNNEVLLQWLRQHIYRYGRFYSSGDLCSKATGEKLDSRYFISYAKQKFKKIYVP